MCELCDGGVTAMNPGFAFKEIGGGYFACGCDQGKAAYARYQERDAVATFQASLPDRYAVWSFKTGPGIGKWERVRKWAVGEGDTDKPWVLIYGLTGRGKTGLAISAARERCRVLRQRGRYTSMVDEFNNIKREFRNDSAAYTEALISTPVLVVDELGVGQMTPWKKDIVFEIIHYRHAHNLSTLWTTDQHEALVDILQPAAYRRLVDASLKIHLDGAEIDSGEMSAYA